MSGDTSSKAFGLLYGQLLRQANLLAYMDSFRTLAVLALLCLPVVFLFRRAKHASPAGAH